MAKPQRVSQQDKEFPYHRPRDVNQNAKYILDLALGNIKERPRKKKK